jgi:hypothetical protein
MSTDLVGLWLAFALHELSAEVSVLRFFRSEPE